MKDLILKTSYVLHVFIDIIPFIYLLFVSKKYDIFIVTLVTIQCLHWIALKNECIISYMDKVILNENYKLGDNISYIPHEDDMYYNKIFVILLHVLQILVFLIILYRNKNDLLISSLSTFNIVVMIQLIYFRYFV
jgi:hypothetical protein